MKFLYLCFAIPLYFNSLSVCQNESFIDHYLNPSVRSYCTESQEKLEFVYSFRARSRYDRDQLVYLFTEDQVFSVSYLKASLNETEENDFVLSELLFNGTEVKHLTAFWDNNYKNETYNTVFSTVRGYGQSIWLFGDKYRNVSIDLKAFKVIFVNNSVNLNESEFGFMRNKKIEKLGLGYIFGVDIAKTWSQAFEPIRVYVRDVKNNGNAISFAFTNISQTEEEWKGGKQYHYRFDSAAYLNNGRSLNRTLKYNHYFELRTRKGIFSLFDFTNNRDFLLTGTNEELLGCPPSFCHWRRFDDIIRLLNGTKFLIYREWVWNFEKPGNAIDWEKAVIANISSRNLLRKDTNGSFKFAIRHIVDGSFTDERKLYIFRNGSFISSKNDTIFESLTDFSNYKRIDSFFKGIPSKTFDALLYYKKLRIVYFILDDIYWSYSMSTNSLLTANEPKNIEELGLPSKFRVKATYVDEDESGNQIKFYFFAENHYIEINSTQFKSNRFESLNPIFFCTSVNFLGCASNEEFDCPQIQVTTASTPDHSSNTTKDNRLNNIESNLLTYLYILMAIIGLLIAFIVFIEFVIKLKQKPKKETISDINDKNKENEENPKTATNNGNHKQNQQNVSQLKSTLSSTSNRSIILGKNSNL